MSRGRPRGRRTVRASAVSDLKKNTLPLLLLLLLLRKPTTPKRTGPGGFFLLQVCEEEKTDGKSHIVDPPPSFISELLQRYQPLVSPFTSRRRDQRAAETKGGEGQLYLGVHILDFSAHGSGAGARCLRRGCRERRECRAGRGEAGKERPRAAATRSRLLGDCRRKPRCGDRRTRPPASSTNGLKSVCSSRAAVQSLGGSAHTCPPRPAGAV